MQIHDTAMVPKNACSYADLAMGIVDHKAKSGGKIKPLPWSDTEMTFLTYGNKVFLHLIHLRIISTHALYPTIKFELVYSDSHLNVLNITLHFG